MKILKDLLYTKEHEWVRVEGDKAYIGITDFAQHALGSIVFIDLPEVDTQLNAGDIFGAVESVKAASDVYSPLEGSVVEINEDVVDNPALVNEDAYENWMIAMEVADESQLETLLSAKDYKEFCSKEV